MKKMSTNLFSRAPKILKSALKLTAKKDLEDVVEELSQLKGLPQKLGQIISMDFSDYLPEEIKDKFTALQAQSKAFESEEILAIIKKGLTQEKFSLIDQFSPNPLGTGSIGQVHHAVINNRQVVFKVRYPEIEKTVKTDLALMQPIALSYEFFRPKSKDFTILIKEANIMLLQEMDYQSEIKFLKQFKEALSTNDRFCVPDVIEDFSHENFICMEFIEGMSLKEYIDTEIDIDKKIYIAKNLLELFIWEFFTLGYVQTDPNFANFLIKSDSKIALLDFGATKKFDPSFRALYFELLKASFEENKHDIIYYGGKLGLVDRKDNPEAIDIFVSFMIDVLSYFKKENNPMDFSNEEITQRLFTKGFLLWKKQRISAPNSNLVFLHRKLGGLFSLLKNTKVTIDLHPMWEKIVQINSSPK